jgi:adenylate cyclase
MFERLTALNDNLVARGLPGVNYGIGLHSGDVVAAHVGSTVRMQYSVIGDTINLASRHCRIAREGQIALSPITLALAGDVFDAVPIEDVEFKGVADHRTAYLIQAGPTAPSGSPELTVGTPQHVGATR